MFKSVEQIEKEHRKKELMANKDAYQAEHQQSVEAQTKAIRNYKRPTGWKEHFPARVFMDGEEFNGKEIMRTEITETETDKYIREKVSQTYPNQENDVYNRGAKLVVSPHDIAIWMEEYIKQNTAL